MQLLEQKLLSVALPLLCVRFVLAPMEREEEGGGREGGPEIRQESSRGTLHVRTVRWSLPCRHDCRANQIADLLLNPQLRRNYGLFCLVVVFCRF